MQMGQSQETNQVQAHFLYIYLRANRRGHHTHTHTLSLSTASSPGPSLPPHPPRVSKQQHKERREGQWRPRL